MCALMHFRGRKDRISFAFLYPDPIDVIVDMTVGHFNLTLAICNSFVINSKSNITKCPKYIKNSLQFKIFVSDSGFLYYITLKIHSKS